MRIEEIPVYIREKSSGMGYRVFPSSSSSSSRLQGQTMVLGTLPSQQLFSALVIIGRSWDKIKKLFVSDTVTPEGIYAVNLTKNGERIEVVVDDYIPCNEHR